MKKIVYLSQKRLASISSSKCVGKSCEFGWLHDLTQKSDQQHLTSENTPIPSRHSHERGRPHHFEQEHAHPIHYGGQRTVRYPILVHTTAPEHQVQEASMRRRAWPGVGARRSAQTRYFGTAVNRSGENDRIPGFEGFRRDKATGTSTFTAPTGLGPWGQAMAAYGIPTFPSNTEAEEMLQPSGMGARRDSPGGPENLAVPREIPVEPSGAAQVPAEDRIPSLIGNSRALSNTLSDARPIVTVAGNVVSPENLVSEGRIPALSVSEARARGHDYISAGDAAGIERTRQIPPLRTSPSPSAATQMERRTASTPDTRTTIALAARTGDYATAAASRAVSERGYTSAVGLTPVSLGFILTAVAGAAPAVANAGAASAISTTVSAAAVRKDLPDAVLGESMVVTGRARDTAHDVAVSRVRGTNALESCGASLRSGLESAASVNTATSVASRPHTGLRVAKRIDRIYNPASSVYGGRMRFKNR